MKRINFVIISLLLILPCFASDYSTKTKDELALIIERLEFDNNDLKEEIDRLKQKNLLLQGKIEQLKIDIERAKQSMEIKSKSNQELNKEQEEPQSIEEVKKVIEYKIKNNDTLTGIALKFYHDAKYWRYIREKNKEIISPKGSIRIGQKIKIYPLGEE